MSIFNIQETTVMAMICSIDKDKLISDNILAMPYISGKSVAFVSINTGWLY